VQIGLIGCGSAAWAQAKAYHSLQLPVAAAADPDEKAAQDLAAYLGADAYPSLEKLLSSTDVDMLHICAPTSLHAKLVREGLEAGKHVLCEAPLTLDAETAKALVDLAEKGKRQLAVGHVFRYAPEYEAAKNQLEQGHLGSPAVVRTSRSRRTPIGWQRWYQDARLSGGVILDSMLHDLDFLIWCFGQPKRILVKTTRGRGLQGMEHALATVRMKNGVIAHMEAGWSNTSNADYTAFEISTRSGMISHDSREVKGLEIDGVQNPWVTHGPASDLLVQNAYERQLQDVVRCFAANGKPRCTGRDALQTMQAGEAALASVAANSVIHLAQEVT